MASLCRPDVGKLCQRRETNAASAQAHPTLLQHLRCMIAVYGPQAARALVQQLLLAHRDQLRRFRGRGTPGPEPHGGLRTLEQRLRTRQSQCDGGRGRGSVGRSPEKRPRPRCVAIPGPNGERRTACLHRPRGSPRVLDVEPATASRDRAAGASHDCRRRPCRSTRRLFDGSRRQRADSGGEPAHRAGRAAPAATTRTARQRRRAVDAARHAGRSWSLPRSQRS